jgi:hypothetical protein
MYWNRAFIFRIAAYTDFQGCIDIHICCIAYSKFTSLSKLDFLHTISHLLRSISFVVHSNSTETSFSLLFLRSNSHSIQIELNSNWSLISTVWFYFTSLHLILIVDSKPVSLAHLHATPGLQQSCTFKPDSQKLTRPRQRQPHSASLFAASAALCFILVWISRPPLALTHSVWLVRSLIPHLEAW